MPASSKLVKNTSRKVAPKSTSSSPQSDSSGLKIRKKSRKRSSVENMKVFAAANMFSLFFVGADARVALGTDSNSLTTALPAPESTCSLYEIDSAGAVCGQSDIDCKYSKYAKIFESGLKDGTCPDQGYTVAGTSSTKSYPVIGDVTITQYTKPSDDGTTEASSASAVESTCSLYAISDDKSTCGQSDIDCKYTKFAKLAESSLKDGTCSDQGYTVEGTSSTKSYPIIGDVTITQYTKA